MTPEELQIIKTELTTDPLGRGYASMNDERAASAFNRPDRTVDRGQLSSGVLVSCLDKTEYSALSAADKEYLRLFVSAADVPMTTEIRQSLREMFPAQSKTRRNINKSTRRPGSRADEIGLGNVTPSDIADAKRL